VLVSSLLYVPHYRAISFFDHPKRVWCGSTDHKAPRYVACPTSITSSLVDSVFLQCETKTTGKITVLCILIFMLRGNKWEMDQMVGHAFTEFSLLLISSWMQFLKYINFSTLSEDLLHVFIVWLTSHLQQDMTWIFIFSTFTYRPVSLATNNAGVWYICICAINYQHKAGANVSHSVSFLLFFLTFPNGISWKKV